ncbi:kelch-like protein 26 isoform X3 [Branchiostoma lanceolatum]|uniref:kelch-like protein 26 isoform X3 n=1 Tax=Branchiostoma lanceolatum TaxID=7740 RepID=UPI00345237C8
MASTTENLSESQSTIKSCPNHAVNLLKGFKSLWEDGTLSDLLLRSSDGRTFPIHKILLATCSQTIKRNLNSLKQGETYKCGRVPPAALSLVTQYIYTGVHYVNEESVETVNSVAELLEMETLKTLCKIAKDIGTQDVQTEEQVFHVTRSDKGLQCLRNDTSLTNETETCDATRLSIALDNVKSNGVSKHVNRQTQYHNFPAEYSNGICMANDDHFAEVVQGLQHFRSDVTTCDVILVAEHATFPVHRAVLSACSDYFRAMFTVGMRECGEKKVTLHGLTPVGVSAVVHYMYTGEVHLSATSLQSVLETANVLLINDVLDICLEYLLETMSVNSCLTRLHQADCYSLDRLEAAADDFILAHITQVAKLPQFQDLVCDKLCAYLDSDQLGVSNELEAFRVALTWLNHDFKARRQFAGHVMSHIRFPLMSIEDLVRHVRTVDFMRRDEDCRALVMEATRYQKCPTQQILLQTRRTQVLYLDPALSSSWKPDAELPWQQVEELPSRGRMYHAVAVLDNFLYVAGGFSKCVWLSTFHMYDPRWNKWFELEPLLDPRSEFCLVALDRSMYAVGGWKGKEINTTVEKYSFEEDRWEYAASLDVGLHGHACCVHGNRVYISGGRSIARGRNGFRLYDPESGVTELSPLRHARSNHAMAAVPGGFLVFGGENGTTTIAQVEMYSLGGNCWMEVSTWPFPVCWFGHCVLDTTLYIFGGFNHANSKYTDTVQTLDLDRWEKWEWSIMGRLPYRCDGIAAAILTLPEEFKQETEARTRKGSHLYG